MCAFKCVCMCVQKRKRGENEDVCSFFVDVIGEKEIVFVSSE